MRYKFLTGDINFLDFGGKWISKKLNNGDFDYYLVMELMNMRELTGDDDQPKYNVTVGVVAPSQVDESKIRELVNENFGYEGELTDEMRVEALHQYGTYAPVWQGNGNNARNLMRDARNQPIETLFGFYMDKPINRMGATGWNWVRGDILGQLSR